MGGGGNKEESNHSSESDFVFKTQGTNALPTVDVRINGVKED